MDSELKDYLDAWFARREREFDNLMALMEACPSPTNHNTSTPAVSTDGVTEPVTASSDTAKLVTESAGLPEPPATVSIAEESLVVAPAIPMDTIAMVPATCSTDCATQAITVSTTTTLLSCACGSSPSPASPATSATSDAISTELATDNDDEQHGASLAMDALVTSASSFTVEDVPKDAQETSCGYLTKQSAVNTILLCNTEDVPMYKVPQHEEGQWQPWPPPWRMWITSDRHMSRPRSVSSFECKQEDVPSISLTVQLWLCPSSKAESCAHSPDNKYMVTVNLLAHQYSLAVFPLELTWHLEGDCLAAGVALPFSIMEYLLQRDVLHLLGNLSSSVSCLITKDQCKPRAKLCFNVVFLRDKEWAPHIHCVQHDRMISFASLWHERHTTEGPLQALVNGSVLALFLSCSQCIFDSQYEPEFSEFQQLNLYKSLLLRAEATQPRFNPVKLLTGEAAKIRCGCAEFKYIIVRRPTYLNYSTQCQEGRYFKVWNLSYHVFQRNVPDGYHCAGEDHALGPFLKQEHGGVALSSSFPFGGNMLPRCTDMQKAKSRGIGELFQWMAIDLLGGSGAASAAIISSGSPASTSVCAAPTPTEVWDTQILQQDEVQQQPWPPPELEVLCSIYIHSWQLTNSGFEVPHCPVRLMTEIPMTIFVTCSVLDVQPAYAPSFLRIYLMKEDNQKSPCMCGVTPGAIPYGPDYFRWEIAWQRDGECFYFFQWHVVWALSISSTSKDSQRIIAGVSPHGCSFGVHYCHGHIFEGCPSECFAPVLLLYRNYGHMNSCTPAIPCNTASHKKYASDSLIIEGKEVLITGSLPNIYCCNTTTLQSSNLMMDSELLYYYQASHLHPAVLEMQGSTYNLFSGRAHQARKVQRYMKSSYSDLSQEEIYFKLAHLSFPVVQHDTHGASHCGSVAFCSYFPMCTGIRMEQSKGSSELIQWLADKLSGVYQIWFLIDMGSRQVSPSILLEASAWGQAEFQGGRDVRSLTDIGLLWRVGTDGPSPSSSVATYTRQEATS